MVQGRSVPIWEVAGEVIVSRVIVITFFARELLSLRGGLLSEAIG